jgi:imidazolonepropionase-like amidohydrolase
MNRFSAAALCLFLASGCTNGSEDGKDAAQKDVVFISGALLIPGDGSPPIEEATMIIEDGVITQLGKKKEFYAPRGSLPGELEGKTIAPLFVNLHAYPGLGSLGSFGAENYKRESLSADLNRYGYYGIGAVLAGGDSDGLAFQLRDELREGKTTGAMLYTSGRGIAAKGSSGSMDSIPLLVAGEADARKAVAELADRNVDAIVLWAEGMKSEASNAVVDEAHKRKLKVFADAPGLDEAKSLAKAGVDALIGSVRDRDVDDELISMMKEKKIPLSAALTALEARFVFADRPSWLNDRALREAYPAGLTAYLLETVVVNRFKRNSQNGAYRQQFATASRNLKKLSEAGVPIALGSGSGYTDTFPGFSEHRELELMVEAGLSPMDAITAATSVPATAIGAADSGVLAVGKKASFIIFSSNPLERIKNSQDIDQVYVSGHDIDRLEMIRKIQVAIPKVSQADRAMDAAIQQIEREEEEDRNLKKYGKFALAPQSTNVAPGLTIQTPKRSTASVGSGGPPYRVTVQLARATGAELREFYSKVLPSARWTAAGECWEKTNTAQEGKKWRLCTEPSSGRIVLSISVP